MNNYLKRKMFKQALEAAEKTIYLSAYEHTGQNQVVTARLLGVSRGTLRSRLAKWRLI